MNTRQSVAFFSSVALILILWGIVFAVFGLGVLPVDSRVLLRWESAIYGAIMIGWGVTLFLIGRIALRRGDRELARSLLAGIGAWLAVEALFSAKYGVWFNVGVDVGVFALFSAPLICQVRQTQDLTERSQ